MTITLILIRSPNSIWQFGTHNESGNPTSNQVRPGLLAVLKRIRIEHVLDLYISPGSAQCQLFRTNTQTFNALWQHVRCEYRNMYAVYTTWPKSTSSIAVSGARLGFADRAALPTGSPPSCDPGNFWLRRGSSFSNTSDWRCVVTLCIRYNVIDRHRVFVIKLILSL